MAAYVGAAIRARDDLSQLATETLVVIERLDTKAVKMASEVDKCVSALRGKRAISRKKKKDLRAMHQAVELLSERKAQVAISNYDLINQHICQLDQEIRTLEKAMRMNGDERLMSILGPTLPKAQAAGGRRRNRNDDEEPVIPREAFVVDPNEPVYCLCRQVAFGEMIACDNEECAIEWFHYSCVNLNKKPRSTWLCPDCSRRKRR